MSTERIDRSRILVVDDNLPSAELVEALLARAGLRRVEVLTDPTLVVGRVAEQTPDLVILDLHMPVMDGYTVLTRLREQATPADLPVLVLTADITREATHRALQLGANDFLTKPLDAPELILRVRNLLTARALHDDLLRRHRWLEASARLAAELLADGNRQPLLRVGELARSAAEADGAVIATPGPSTGGAGALPARLWIGDADPAAVEAITAAFDDGALGGEAARPDLGPAAVGPALLVPLGGHGRLLGALLLYRSPGREPFPDGDLELAQNFADQATVALELADARTDQARMLVLTDRHRIARDLHDQVIQRLFATGLRLQQVADQAGPGPLAERIGEHVADLDDTITEIRSTIFGLRQPAHVAPERVRNRLQAIVDELGDVLGFTPLLHWDAPAGSVPEELADDLVFATREALTNVARHAGASWAEVSVNATAHEVVLRVADDGVGLGGSQRRSGLRNLDERARRHGGVCRVSSAAAGGTEVEWRAGRAAAEAAG
jgi:signal transduction histidine kinase